MKPPDSSGAGVRFETTGTDTVTVVDTSKEPLRIPRADSSSYRTSNPTIPNIPFKLPSFTSDVQIGKIDKQG
jgi:hypothetical protein